MLIFKEFLLLSLVILTVHAGHKRIIIKVPQRTRHIYHHHVKKVPVYVLLPEHKPKVITDFETLVKTKPTTTSAPCKEQSPYFEEYSPHYRHARYSHSELDSYHPDWVEDRDNKGAFVPIEGPKQLDREFQPPPVGSDDQIYDYSHVTPPTKKSKKHALRKSVPEPKYSKSALNQQYYSKSGPDQQHYSKPVSDEHPYSKPISDHQHYSKPVSNQQHYSKPIPEQHYSKTPDYQHYTKLIPEKHYGSSYESNSRFLPSSQGIDNESEYSRELEEVFELPPTASGNVGNSANLYASSYQYRINHRMDEIPTTIT